MHIINYSKSSSALFLFHFGAITQAGLRLAKCYRMTLNSDTPVSHPQELELQAGATSPFPFPLWATFYCSKIGVSV